MLFDEKDLQVFDNVESREYFKEILQSYYSQNYRATIVLLYSFVIYDLFLKLQTMANEGDKKALSALDDINQKIEDDEKYSIVENEVIKFFKDNCQLYFNKFIEDIDYLKNCRNKCAHLKVNDNSLYVPNDYHVKMLICSMYDNILSVKAPFITDLFSIAQVDVEKYAEEIRHISSKGLDESIAKYITDKYLIRMTHDSLKKSYRTFMKLLFVSEDDDCIKNVYGLYAFAYTMTEFILKNGHHSIFEDENVLSIFLNIKVDRLVDSIARRKSLASIITKYPIIMDIIQSNTDVFDYISKEVLREPDGLCHYGEFYPRENRTAYRYFIDNRDLHVSLWIEKIYNSIKDSYDFDIAEFTKTMIKAVPNYNGFDDADCFMTFFISHISDLKIEDFNEVMRIYSSNKQCTNRGRHAADIEEINKYLKEHELEQESEIVEQ